METLDPIVEGCIQRIRDLLINGDSNATSALGMLFGGNWLEQIVYAVLEETGYTTLQARIADFEKVGHQELTLQIARLEQDLSHSNKTVQNLENDLKNSESALAEALRRK